MIGKSLASVVRVSEGDLQMLGPLQPAWNKAWSGWSKWSKHFYKLVNRIIGISHYEIYLLMHTPCRTCEKALTTWTTRTTLYKSMTYRCLSNFMLGPCLDHPGPLPSLNNTSIGTTVITTISGGASTMPKT